MFIDFKGRVYSTHPPERCANQQVCVIHHPTVHGMTWWPAIMRTDKDFLVERICPHGTGHPDPDSVTWFESQGDRTMSVHGCDGCCMAAQNIITGHPDIIQRYSL